MGRLLAMAAAFVFVTAACGGDDDSADVDSTSATTTGPTTTGPTRTEPSVATDPPATTRPPSTTEATTPTTTEAPAPTTTEVEPPPTSAPPTTEPAPAEDVDRTDWLTFARGAVFVSQTGLAGGSAGTALLSARASVSCSATGPPCR